MVQVKADFSDIPEYGLWSYSMNSSDTERADTTGYYEVIEKTPGYSFRTGDVEG